MGNEWNKIDLNDYENHMSDSSVFQTQTLNQITRKQTNDYSPSSLVILGIAGGNGLEHCKSIEKVYAIDVNQSYLGSCLSRFPNENVEYIRMDLNKDECNLRNIDLVISNLVFEYINEEIVVPKIAKILKPGGILSIVFQVNKENAFISETRYSEKFICLDSIHHTVDPDYIDRIFKLNNYSKVFEESFPLPNGKAFKRFDFRLE